MEHIDALALDLKPLGPLIQLRLYAGQRLGQCLNLIPLDLQPTGTILQLIFLDGYCFALPFGVIGQSPQTLPQLANLNSQGCGQLPGVL